MVAKLKYTTEQNTMLPKKHWEQESVMVKGRNGDKGIQKRMANNCWQVWSFFSGDKNVFKLTVQLRKCTKKKITEFCSLNS